MASINRSRFLKSRNPARKRLTPTQIAFGRGNEAGKLAALQGRSVKLGKRADSPFGVGFIIGFNSARRRRSNTLF